jgi:hypothetical protein
MSHQDLVQTDDRIGRPLPGSLEVGLKTLINQIQHGIEHPILSGKMPIHVRGHNATSLAMATRLTLRQPRIASSFKAAWAICPWRISVFALLARIL